MKRRQYIAALGVGGLAGCLTFESDDESTNTPGGTAGSSPTPTPVSDGGSTDTPTASPTPSPSPTPPPTPTPTPEPEVPKVQFVTPVSRWEDFGDAEEYAVNGVGQGAPAIIAPRYRAEAIDGSVNVDLQMKVFDASGSRVGYRTDSGEQLVGEDGITEWETSFVFDTKTWSQGTYEVEVIIRDNNRGETSEATAGTFKLNEPFKANGARMTNVDAPDVVEPYENYEFTLTILNESNRDGSVVSPLSARYAASDDDDWSSTNITVATTMGAGETNTFSGYFEGFRYEGEVIFQIDDLGEIWSVDIEE